MKTAVLAGTTGLIGAQVLELLLLEASYGQVIALSRKPLALTHPRLVNLLVNFDDLQAYSAQLKVDDVYCCLGTTMKQAGSKEAFRKVDFEYPAALARITHGQGARQFLMIAAMGANKNSSIFYNKVKGEIQEEVARIGFMSVHIFQPSLLLGQRQEKRVGEGVGEAVMRGLDFLIPKKYKAVDAAKVARGMVAIGMKNMPGYVVHESGELQDY